ncbi:MAG: NAD-dependent epimerase/dehydratase family protein, partial [Eggerthellaceae bacterium]|nr:NAD-dependent epimerase/dehydratase family protein [Eggerthellaceae bacterium]
MNRLSLQTYANDVAYCASLPIDWNRLSHKTVAISGATGMIGTFLIDVLMHKNKHDNLDCTVLGIGRSAQRAKERFPYFEEEKFLFEEMDLGEGGACPKIYAHFVLHLASPTHPRAYATEPISTVASNVIGMMNLIDYADKAKASGFGFERFLLASSVEIYGENRGDVKYFTEEYCGYIDSNTLRASYPESKRLCESLCQAAIAQKQLDMVIARLPRTFGATLLPSDSKALSQFLHKAIDGEDIVLKSEGTQTYSYLHVCDAVAGMLYCLLSGECGGAYNIADASCD